MKLETKLKIACVIVDIVVVGISIFYFKPTNPEEWGSLIFGLFLILVWVDMIILMKDIMNR